MRISDWSSDVCSSDLFEELPLESLPLDAWHRAHGARMVPFAGYEMPIQYEGIVAEHEWTRSHAGLLDRKSVVEGKSVSVRVDRGGRRIIKTKNKKITHMRIYKKP